MHFPSIFNSTTVRRVPVIRTTLNMLKDAFTTPIIGIAVSVIRQSIVTETRGVIPPHLLSEALNL